MSNQLVETDGGRSKKPPRISIASLGTSASGIAESAISYADSELSGISQFPAPPAEIPTPTLSRYGTPTSQHFTVRLPPSIPDYETPDRFHFGTPPASRSPAGSQFSNKSNPQETRSVKSGSSSRTGISNAVGDGISAFKQASSPLASLPAQPSTSYQPVRPLVYRRNPVPHPPISERNLSKRPDTPHSTAAASSLLDWSDATSGISIDTNEERLLTTSFITSLLSQAPDPFPGNKVYDAGKRAMSGFDKRSNQTCRDAVASDEPRSHQSIIPFYPSDLLSAESGEGSTSRQQMLSDDRRSVNADSRRTLKDYSETGHMDEQLQSAIRRPSIMVARGGIEAHPVAVVPAIRLPSSVQRSDDMNNSVITSASMASKPPVHRADAPRNVRQTGGFDGDFVSRESDEDFARLKLDLHQDGPVMTTNAPPPHLAANSQKRASHARSKSRSDQNQPLSSGFTLQRNQSMKSVVSSLVSRISNSSALRRARYLNWLRQRPLPPIPVGTNPPPEFPNGKEIQKSEESIPLPTLVKRADDLSGMLSSGRFLSGADKNNEFHYQEASVPYADLHPGVRRTYTQLDTRSAGQRSSLFSRVRRRKEDPNVTTTGSPSSAKTSTFDAKRKRRRLWIVAIVVVIGVALAIAIPVAISSQNSSRPKCSGNQTVNDVNQLFSSSFTEEEMSDAVVVAAGVPPDGVCSSQALLIDVEPGLDSATAPNRTKWAQAAMLWNLAMTQDVSEAMALQDFVSSAPWRMLSSIDGPVDDSSGRFTSNVSGYDFDFASQTVSPLSAKFRNSSPSEDQFEALSMTAVNVLDRMYSFAIASSTQREKALINYWTSVLQRQESELDMFKTAVRNSAFLIPFDATSSPGGNRLTDIMPNTSSTEFPVPISCYPGLDESQLTRINALETAVFGLDPASTTSLFSESCFPDRPVYGVVDLLGLRLPFPDNREGVALQASALNTDATIRAVMYSGEVLSALPGATAVPDITAATTDAREFGAVDFLDHVLLNYLSSISNASIAMDLVSHVLSSNIPSIGSPLANSLSSLPILEFAVFGIIRPQDVAFSASSFSTPTGSLFFGSDAAQMFRSWALVNTSASIVWTESALSTDVVHEGSSEDDAFESVWQPASELVASGPTNADDVSKVTSSLRSLGLFSP
ncbi:hypothetical protein A7U60_g7343 [Sanghuangporus baumii]|uniref:Uncharacterized protein n=1 Tax=Sanghuangporus baumii TaxID=108892 RepID=A0A9Q5HTH0_SANBA|nr:hypothetical protein A7U60_g7343 [Sanghuangporus baumii]